jgi:DNA helicase-2/ATP-dependent DNA helicase PcrA
MRMPNSREISDEQEEIYVEAPMDGSILIVGPPGTGKTVIAFLRAQTLKRKSKTAQVIMHSKVLQKYTSNIADADDNPVPSSTLHSWVNKWWKSNRIQTASGSMDKVYLDCPFDEKNEIKALGAKWDKFKKKWYTTADVYKKSLEKFARWPVSKMTDTSPPKIADFQYDWDSMLVAAANHENINDWGHLIIDEAQDFPGKMFGFLRFVADKLGDGGLTIMADENQRLNEDENSTISDIKAALAVKEDRIYLLEKNFRNTFQIAEVANSFFVGLASGKPQPPKRQGDKPQLIKTSSLDEQIDLIVRVLSARAPGEVGVFVQRDDMRKKVFNKLQHKLRDQYRVQSYSSKDKGNHPAEDLVFDTKGTLTVLNRHSCKGLEFDFVFIPEIQTIDIDGSSLDTFKMNMYVMCSRAREALYLLYTTSTGEVPEIINHLPGKEMGLLEYKND